MRVNWKYGHKFVTNAARHIRSRNGQSTVEFAVITAALICVIVGCSSFWRLSGQGVLADHAVAAASHHVEGSIGAIADVFAY